MFRAQEYKCKGNRNKETHSKKGNTSSFRRTKPSFTTPSSKVLSCLLALLNSWKIPWFQGCSGRRTPKTSEKVSTMILFGISKGSNSNPVWTSGDSTSNICWGTLRKSAGTKPAKRSSQRNTTTVQNGNYPGFVCEVSSSRKTNSFLSSKTQTWHPFKERCSGCSGERGYASLVSTL